MVERLDARLCLSGHGKPFVDVPGHIDGNRKLVAERLEAVMGALGSEPRTAVEISPEVYDQPLTGAQARWMLVQTLCYLQHLDRQGLVAKVSDNGVERWRAA